MRFSTLPSLDGKTVAFIGNSLIYYGGIVEPIEPLRPNNGTFARVCRAAGDDVTVLNCTYGGHHLYDFTAEGCKRGDAHNGADLLAGLDFAAVDVVFMSESGDDNPNFLADVRRVMERFPNPATRFVYLCHSYSYFRRHRRVTDNLRALARLGVGIVDWGRLVYDVAGGTRAEGMTADYDMASFINAIERDFHHPNPLAGYLASLMCYTVVTGKSAVGADPSVCASVRFGGGVTGFDAYAGRFYAPAARTNFREVFASPDEMHGLQLLCDRYSHLWDTERLETERSVAVCAHRGWSAKYPENSLEAFRAALELGADEIELDVRLTADGKLIVSHDDRLDRISDGKPGELVSTSTFDYLRTLNIGIRQNTVARFCTPEEVFDAVGGKILLNIHLKEAGPDGFIIRELVRLADERGITDSIYFAGSPRELEAMEAYAPQIPRTAIQLRRDTIGIVEMAHKYHCARVQLWAWIYEDAIIPALRADGIRVNLYHAETPDEIRAAVASGVQTILSNNPDVVMETIG